VSSSTSSSSSSLESLMSTREGTLLTLTSAFCSSVAEDSGAYLDFRKMDLRGGLVVVADDDDDDALVVVVPMEGV